MGVVYAAMDEEPGPTSGRQDDPGGGDRDGRAGAVIRREARAAASVNHPNVCQLSEIGEKNQELYLVMECWKENRLAARIAARPATGRREAAQITLAILWGARAPCIGAASCTAT